MDVITWVVGLVTGLLSGIAASVLFAMMSRWFKPKIVIADKIAKTYQGQTSVYKVKFVNLSRHYAKNVHIIAQLIECQNPDSETGVIVQTKPLKFVRTDFSFVEPFDRKDKEERYAVRLVFQNNIEEVWKDPIHHSLEILIYCENEMNGAGKVFKRIYRTPKSIIEGTYETGKSTKIIPY